MDAIHTVTQYGPGGASARVRVFEWLDHLHLPAVRHTYAGLASNSVRTLSTRPAATLRAEASIQRLPARLSSSTLLLSKQASPFSNGGLERRLLSSAGHAVYDFDDALFVQQRGVAGRIFSKRRAWKSAVRAADTVIAGNDYLAERASAELGGSGRVTVIPSCVDPDDYVAKASYELHDPPAAVWLGSPSTEKYLSIVAEPLLELNARSGLRLTVVSAGDTSLGILDPIVDRERWTPEIQTRLHEWDFGVMPLTDDEYSRGKCAYKLLQYAAAGLPVVASPFGANAAALDKLDGMRAAGHHDWVEALIALTQSSEARRLEWGTAARRGVRAYYSYTSWQRCWLATMGLT